MTAPPSIDLSGWLTEQLGQASPDLLRQMITTFVQALMSADADAVCGAEYGVRSTRRTNTRNGYRQREWDTRAGTIELAIPKLRSGSYFPDWLLERRRRAEARYNSGDQPIQPTTGANDDGAPGNADQYRGDRVGREPFDVSSYTRPACMTGTPVQYEQSDTG